MPPTFEKLLAELIKRAASPDDDPFRCEFDDGDTARLGRWLNSGEANKIWEKISSGPFNSGDAFEFVITVLDFRRMAEEADTLNKGISGGERHLKRLAPKARKRAIRKLEKNEIAPEQYAAINQRIEKALRNAQVRDPLLSVRSDENGTRQRTLFCRMLSYFLHDTIWHDAEVAALCEIVFDCGDVTVEMVRSARRESKPRR